MTTLNENQLIAARHVDGPMMVLAGPGSGKTAVIVARAAILCKERDILVITYSKAAAREMERRFSGADLQGGKSRVTFGTFHSVLYRILRRKKGLAIGEILAEGEQRAIVRDCLAEMQYEPDDEMLSSLLSEMSLVRNELYEICHYHSKTIGTGDFLEVCKIYENYKIEKNKIDFDDMLCHAYELLKSDPVELDYWRKKYPFIMVDEFQDINCVQYEAIKLLAAPKNNLFIVGDDDQSIYRFRGSRPEFLLNFPKDFDNSRQITLETNYRSTDAIIKYSNNLIVHNKMRYSKDISGMGQKGSAPKIIVSDDQNQEALKIAEMVRGLWKKGANLDEIAIAFRLNIQARAFTDAFLNMNIPFKSRDESPTIYEHWIAKDFFAFLNIAKRLGLGQKAGFDPDAARIINKPYRFISKAFLQNCKKNDKSIFTEYKRSPMLHIATKTHIEDLHRNLLILAKLESSGENVSESIRYIRQNIGYNGHIIDTSEYRKLNPAGLMEIADELQEAAKQFEDFAKFSKHAENIASVALYQNIESPCCTFTTLHSAKGLEFERVFIAGLVEEVLPYIRSKTAAEIEEERRLFYVGVTRAKNELYLSTIKSRYDKPAKPSRFLNIDPPIEVCLANSNHPPERGDCDTSGLERINWCRNNL
ncbi:MAG: ATP-dependent helicase [Defluviitaleaceae bacterium]|nr:ATP-dependent helicase [Defluviitaleaceae bacterium]